MKIDNEIYESHGHTWWAEDAACDVTSLRYCVNPVRYGYFKRVLQSLELPGKTLLDVGCGGGFLAEEFAKDGFLVTGLEPAGASLDAARRHAAANGLAIDYRGGRGEDIPFPDSSFDLVTCCDVLEHVADPGKVIAEVSRTLKVGGVFFYDTINRTWFSKIGAIKVWQDWAHICRPNTHIWEMFIKPSELVAMMRRNNLDNRELRGIAPRTKNPFALLWTLRGIRNGKIRNEALTAALDMCETDRLDLSYMGFAIKLPAA